MKYNFYPPPHQILSNQPSDFSKIHKFLFVITTLFFLLGMVSCRKDKTFSKEKLQENFLTVEDAKRFFDQSFSQRELNNAFSVSSSKISERTASRYIIKAPNPQWDAAALKNLSIGTNAVLVPLHIENAYVHVSTTKMVHYGFLN